VGEGGQEWATRLIDAVGLLLSSRGQSPKL